MISPCDDHSWTSENSNQKLEETSYQKLTFEFNDWIKLTQQLTWFTLNNILDSQSIDYEKWNKKTANLAMTFHDPVRGENPYVWF